MIYIVINQYVILYYNFNKIASVFHFFNNLTTMFLIKLKYLKYYIRPGKMSAQTENADEYVMIDFSYQMDKRAYVSDAYTNFTWYNRLGAFIESAEFLLSDGEKVSLTDISTLDRNVKQGYIRVSTILAKQYVEKILKALHKAECVLNVTFDDGSTKSFVSTTDLQERILEAFSK